MKYKSSRPRTFIDNVLTQWSKINLELGGSP